HSRQNSSRARLSCSVSPRIFFFLRHRNCARARNIGVNAMPANRRSMGDLPTLRPQLARFRKRAGLTQAELARRVGRSVRWISAIENGRAGYYSEGLERAIAHALNLTPDEIALSFGYAAWRPETIAPARGGGAPAPPIRVTAPARPPTPGRSTIPP